MSQPDQNPANGRPAALIRPTVEPKTLRSLLGLLNVSAEPTDATDTAMLTGVTLDSRRVAAGDLYAALPGEHVHGAMFAAQAVAAGAVAVLTDEAGAQRLATESISAPVVVVPDPRARLGEVSAWVYDYPARDLRIIGVTGTDGKTTVAMLAESGLRACGFATGLIGTVVTRIGDEELAAVRTTPEAPDLHALLALMRERGVQAVAMEVSSHALSLGRVAGVDFDVAVFTNLGHDHLDFHGDQESYFQAKALLFTPAYTQNAVISVDDAWGRRLASESHIRTTTFSISANQQSTEDSGESVRADWTTSDVTMVDVGWTFTIHHGDSQVAGGCPLPGLFNVSNALAATIAVASISGDEAGAAAGVAASRGVPGRMQLVTSASPVIALVDYAHTPDAVTRAIEVGRDVARARGGRLIAVLGCGGDRDREKRPLMGAAAAAGADITIITDDNPRSEDPAAIRQEMMAGVATVVQSSVGQVHEIGDRVQALNLAVSLATGTDVILALGKGHEATQEINGQRIPLDDRVILSQALVGGVNS